MTGPARPTRPVKTVRARRISTGGTARAPEEERIGVALEAPVTIDIENGDTFTVLCTPGENRAMALGFLYSEGLIDGLDDVGVMRECKDDPGILRVRLVRDGPRTTDTGRNLLIVSSCGACGSEELRARIEALPRVGDTMRIPASILPAVSEGMRGRQTLFRACGGTHAAGIFDAEGNLLACAEDTGRHNALDKAIGQCLLNGEATAGRGAALSGRVSLEMIGKCVRAGIELITAISAPTSLAIEVARKCDITLCAFVRDTRATVFTHLRRITAAPG